MAGLVVSALVALVAIVAVWALSPGKEAPQATAPSNETADQPEGSDVSVGIKGIIEYMVWDANGTVKESGVIHNTINAEALDEVFKRIAGTSGDTAGYDGIAALSVPDMGGGADDPADGVDSTSITLLLDGDSGTNGDQNPADGTVGAPSSGAGTVVVTFTATGAADVKQIVLTKASEDNTLTGGGAVAIADADIFAYVDVPDISLTASDTVQYTWTVDVD